MAVLNIKFAVEVDGVKREIPIMLKDFTNEDNPDNVSLIDYITNNGTSTLKIGDLYFFHRNRNQENDERESIGVFKIGSDGLIYLKFTDFKDEEIKSGSFSLSSLEWRYYRYKHKYDEIKAGTAWKEFFDKDDGYIDTIDEATFANGADININNEVKLTYIYVGTLAGYSIYKGVAS